MKWWRSLLKGLAVIAAEVLHRMQRKRAGR